MIVFDKPKSLTDAPLHYCPGCTHGIIHRLVAEAIDELGIEGRTIGIAPVGCSVMAYNYFTVDMVQAAHGRAPAVATGVKRADPSKIVFTYQGDGDLASIGTCETVHAAARGENITIIFVNNAIYGMTGGQMAPTSLPGQITQTSPYGRDVNTQGYPVKVCEMLSQLDGAGYLERVAVNNAIYGMTGGQMAPTSLIGQKTTTSPLGRSAEKNGNPIRVSEMLATLDGPAYIERVSVHDVKHVIAAKKAILKAFKNQVEGKGFSMVEVLSTCSTNWGMTPTEALKWLEANMIPQYPLGVYKEV